MTSYTAPITCGSVSDDYTHKFKKHFGDRPTSFALSPHSLSSSSSNHACSSSPSLVQPFASSSSLSCHHPSSTPSVEESFASSSRCQAGVDEETHTTLANLGWRIRSRVNQGYSRTTTSLDVGGFVSESDVLRNVTNTRRGWSRVSTAPSGRTLDDLRMAVEAETTAVDPTVTLEGMGKRRLSESDHEDHTAPTTEAEEGGRRIAGLPKLSFSSTSSGSSVFSTSPSFSANANLGLAQTGRSKSFVRTPSQRLPPQAMDVDMHTDADGPYDFSTHFNRTDF